MRYALLLGLPLGIVLALSAALAEGGADYQKVADGARWNWREEMANPLSWLSQCGDKYDIRLVSPKGDRSVLDIAVLLDGKEVYSWHGHRASVFIVRGDKLYYADFSTGTSGGKVVAVDLTTGKELWRSPLKALGEIAHSQYDNRMMLDANGGLVTIYGNESQGQYVEFKDIDTGQTVGHKQFTKEEVAKSEVGPR
jgi:hypothetical protein